VPHAVVHELHAGSPEALRDAYLRIDVGIGFRRDTRKTRFNSAVKLVNFMSFGIPAVLSPELGFLEAGRHGETCFFATSARELRAFADRLARDPVLRSAMGAAALSAADEFRIDRVADHYRRLFDALLDGGLERR
jgi:glycosyltransferase involved in cell wall biosynthesis